MALKTTTQSTPGAHNITRVVLENGIVVLVYENHAAQSVVINASVRAGSQFETPAKNGLASLTANALLRGTGRYDFDTLNDLLESAGADLDINGAVHRVNVNGKALAEDLTLLLDLLADALREPTFPADHIERLRGELITGLHFQMQNTRYRASRAFRETLFPAHHPYHYSTSGTLETVPTISDDEMRAFHARHYGPAGMIITIVGAVSAQHAVERVRERFMDWHNAEQPELPPIPEVVLPATTTRAFVGLAGKTQSDIVMGALGPSRFADDYLAAQLANSVLGQFGMMGRIGASVREQAGLAYYAGSQLDGGYAPSPWLVSAGVNPKNVESAIEKITEQIQRIIDEPVSEEDLAQNQSYFTGRLPLQLETNEGIAASIMNMEIYALGLDHLVKYHDKIYALTRADLQAAARKYLKPSQLVIGVSGPDDMPPNGAS